MQKIGIKDFGTIKDAEIKLTKTLVLIGEQASGKSTIAKLIYYFKSIQEDLFNTIYRQSFQENEFQFDVVKYLINPAHEKFYNFFGATLELRDFEITFYYNIAQNKYLKLTLNNDRKLHSTFSDGFKIAELGTQLTALRQLLPKNIDEDSITDKLAFNQEKLRYAERLSILLKQYFCCEQDDSLFVVAGRNATVGYSDSFERQFLFDKQKTLEVSYNQQQQTIDETLMLSFMDRVLVMKGIFKKFGNFESYSKMVDPARQAQLAVALRKINDIMKGSYSMDSWGEKIVFGKQSKEYVQLSNASSGQQEVIRILQDIFLSIAQNKKLLRIIEEPEAHLFPVAQKQVIELLVQMAKGNDDNQLIITTHSPYVLTILNNLLFAQRVIDNNPDVTTEVAKIVGEECQLKASDLSAYVLDREDTSIIAKSIIDTATGLIEQNYLDTVSEVLSNDFNALYKIHAN